MSMVEDIPLGERLRKIRNELGETQEQFAERIGVTERYVSMIENGQRNISSQVLANACVSLSLSLSADYILFGNRNKANASLVIEMLSNLNQQSIDHAEEILKHYILGITEIKKNYKEGGSV